MDHRIINQPITPIRQPTRIVVRQFMSSTGSIAGHICGPAGGGEVAFVPSSPGGLGEHPMQGERKHFLTLIRLAVILTPIVIGCLFWASYRNHASLAAPSKAITAARSLTPLTSSTSLETPVIDAHGNKGLDNAQRAIMFSIAPLTSLSAMTTPVDPDPAASFRQLIALPPDTGRGAPHIDARRLRTIVDRGVVGYATGKTDGDRARGAGLIQTAALVGFPPARDLLARNYPQSEAVRSVVPANDAIRYALAPLMDAATTSEDSKRIFLALGQHFALQGQLDLFATQILSSLRGDSRPQLNHRLDTLLDLLAHVRGACGALARLVPGARDASDQKCSFSERLHKYIEMTTPAGEEEESKRRGLLMLNQLGGR
jgi:hypothetical protein